VFEFLKTKGEKITFLVVCSYAHQKQLVASFETLLTHCLFGEKSIISWPFFCNVVQEFFCTHLQSEDAPIESGKVV
jgi:hypothetical protein